jgi:type IV secretion system protein VirD4
MSAKKNDSAVTQHDPVVMAELTGAAASVLSGAYLVLTHDYLILAALIAFAAFVVFYLALLSPRAGRRNRTRTLRWRARCKLRPGRGYATTAELAFHWSRLSAVKDGGQARPELGLWARLTGSPVDYAVRLGKAQYGTRLYGRMVDATLVMSPQRMGKSGVLAARIADHPGGVLATSTRADLLQLTKPRRAALGRIHVFNPQGVGDVPSTMRFDLIGPCRDFAMAFRMATWLSGGGLGSGHGNMEWFETKGETALAAFLFAAAWTGATIRDVFRWNQMEDYEVAVKALAEYGTPELLSVARRALADNRTAGSVRDTVELALRWAAIPQIADAVTPRPGEPVLDVEELALRNGTLHIIAGGDENSPLTPVIRTLTSYIHYQAGLIGTRQPAGKLASPLLLALDELTQICPIAVPEMLADSAGKGILMVLVAHSISQLEERYGTSGAQTIWSTCGVKMLLPGISNDETLQTVQRICDAVEDGEGHQVPVVPVGLLRTLPDWHALVIRTNRSPVIVRIPSVYRRWPAKYFTRQTRQASPETAPASLPESVDIPVLAERKAADTADLMRVPDPRPETSAWPGDSQYDPYRQ